MAVAAAQKNREMFAIKKSYSIEVRTHHLTIISHHSLKAPPLLDQFYPVVDQLYPLLRISVKKFWKVLFKLSNLASKLIQVQTQNAKSLQ